MKVTYHLLAQIYDFIDVIYFRKHGMNPRREIMKLIPDEKVKVLDLCCGTMANGIEIAKNRKKARITGVDLSREMLEIANQKIHNIGLENAAICHGDASNLKYPSHEFDYIIMALVLHEKEPKTAAKMLREARRLLKEDGRLIVLEWERPRNIFKRAAFLPIKLLEPKPFRQFYYLDKKQYFNEHAYDLVQRIHCDYSCVYELSKKKNDVLSYV